MYWMLSFGVDRHRKCDIWNTFHQFIPLSSFGLLDIETCVRGLKFVVTKSCNQSTACSSKEQLCTIQKRDRRPGPRPAATSAGSSACTDVWCFCRCVRCLKVAGHRSQEWGRNPRWRLLTWRRRPSENENVLPQVGQGCERSRWCSAIMCFFRLLRSAKRRRQIPHE